MYVMHEYSDFLVESRQRSGPRSLTRRGILIGCSTLAAASIFAPERARAIDPAQIVNGVNAVVGLVTNVDALAGRILPKVQSFFGNSNSHVTNETASRIADAIDNELSNSQTQAVSIAENRTNSLQQGNLVHGFDQQFSQAFIDWCTCSAQMNQQAADYWANIAQNFEQQGDYGRAQSARNLAVQDRQNVNMYLAKIRNPVYVPPQAVSLRPSKPLLTAVSLPDQVTNVLDKGDYCVTHCVAQLNKDSVLTRA